MKKNYIICFFTIMLAIPFTARDVMAMGVFSGKVVRIDKGDIYVHRKGRRYKFKIPMGITYYPNRPPRKGEWIKIKYEDKKSFFSRNIKHVARTVIIYKFTSDKELSGELTVKVSKANLRAGPRKDYGRLGVAGPGETLIVRGKTGNWYKVALPEQNLLRGWVHSSVVNADSIIKPSSLLPLPALPQGRYLSDYIQPIKPQSF
ncbi:MAG: SH3 domain-containing protein [Desulfobacteraceae bacterium]|nr:SH3 domain-containing protein [Desulfobacteraceae bacterium]